MDMKLLIGVILLSCVLVALLTTVAVYDILSDDD